MLTGGILPFLRDGTWNCTYIWPMVIWFGVFAWLGVFGGGTVAKFVTFGTPPMKKLPWSSITSGFVRNFFVLLPSCARTLAPIVTSRTAENRHEPTCFIERLSRVMESSSGPGQSRAGCYAP